MTHYIWLPEPSSANPDNQNCSVQLMCVSNEQQSMSYILVCWNVKHFLSAVSYKTKFFTKFPVEAFRPSSKADGYTLENLQFNTKYLQIFLVNMLLNALIVALLPLGGYATDTTNIFLPSERSAHNSFFSFLPLGDDVAMGLDFELPFLKVPIKRYVDKYGNSPVILITWNILL